MSARGRRSHLHLVVAATVLVLDQASKSWAVDALEGGRSIHVVWTLQLRLAFNTGASFSLGSDFGPVIGLVATVVAVGMALYGRHQTGTLAVVSIGLIIGGALGNVVDRALREGDGFLGGAVVDFIDLQWWSVFNIADSCVVVGGILLVWATREATVEKVNEVAEDLTGDDHERD
jgi:signal peptidase II